MINPDDTTKSYDQGRYAKDDKVSRQIRSRGLCPFPFESIAALFEIIPEPPIVKVVAQAYSSILYLKPNITTFHTTLDWLQSSLSFMECREHETIYLTVPLRTWRNWEPSLPLPAHSDEAKCASNFLRYRFPCHYGMSPLPSDAVKYGQTDRIRGGEGLPRWWRRPLTRLLPP